jgi:site-specific recombinase XerD
MKSLTLSTAIDGFLLDLAARRLSPHTVADYTNSLRKLQAFLVGDPELESITADQLRQFMADLETPRRPAGVTQRPLRGLSKKQCLNIHTGLSAFYTWALRNLVIGLMRTAGETNIAAAGRRFAAQPWAALALIGIPARIE